MTFSLAKIIFLITIVIVNTASQSNVQSTGMFFLAHTDFTGRLLMRAFVSRFLAKVLVTAPDILALCAGLNDDGLDSM